MYRRTQLLASSALLSSPSPGCALSAKSVLSNRYDNGGMPAGRSPYNVGTTNIQASRNNNKKLKYNKNLSHSIQFNSRRPFLPWQRVYSNANGIERLEQKVLVSNY